MPLTFKFYLNNSENALVMTNFKAVDNFVHNTVNNSKNYKVSIYDEQGKILEEKQDLNVILALNK